MIRCVVGAVRRQQRAGVLEVLALGVALQRLRHGLLVPVGEKDAPVGRGQRVALPQHRHHTAPGTGQAARLIS